MLAIAMTMAVADVVKEFETLFEFGGLAALLD